MGDTDPRDLNGDLRADVHKSAHSPGQRHLLTASIDPTRAVEVGIADASGRSQSWLICPHRSWDGWDWTQEAQSLHGLTHERLEREGLPASVVAEQLVRALAGHLAKCARMSK